MKKEEIKWKIWNKRQGSTKRSKANERLENNDIERKWIFLKEKENGRQYRIIRKNTTMRSKLLDNK